VDLSERTSGSPSNGCIDHGENRACMDLDGGQWRSLEAPFVGDAVLFIQLRKPLTNRSRRHVRLAVAWKQPGRCIKGSCHCSSAPYVITNGVRVLVQRIHRKRALDQLRPGFGARTLSARSICLSTSAVRTIRSLTN